MKFVTCVSFFFDLHHFPHPPNRFSRTHYHPNIITSTTIMQHRQMAQRCKRAFLRIPPAKRIGSRRSRQKGEKLQKSTVLTWFWASKEAKRHPWQEKKAKFEVMMRGIEQMLHEIIFYVACNKYPWYILKVIVILWRNSKRLNVAGL